MGLWKPKKHKCKGRLVYGLVLCVEIVVGEHCQSRCLMLRAFLFTPVGGVLGLSVGLTVSSVNVHRRVVEYMRRKLCVDALRSLLMVNVFNV